MPKVENTNATSLFINFAKLSATRPSRIHSCDIKCLRGLAQIAPFDNLHSVLHNESRALLHPSCPQPRPSASQVRTCTAASLQLLLSSPDITELLTAHVFHHHFSNDYHYTAIKFSVTASYLADFFPIFKERDHRRRGKNEGLGGTEGCRVEEEGEVPGWKTMFKLEQHMLLWSYVTWPYYYHVNTNQIYYHLIVGSQQTNTSPSLFIRAFTASCYFDSSPSTSLLPF